MEITIHDAVADIVRLNGITVGARLELIAQVGHTGGQQVKHDRTDERQGIRLVRHPDRVYDLAADDRLLRAPLLQADPGQFDGVDVDHVAVGVARRDDHTLRTIGLPLRIVDRGSCGVREVLHFTGRGSLGAFHLIDGGVHLHRVGLEAFQQAIDLLAEGGLGSIEDLVAVVDDPDLLGLLAGGRGHALRRIHPAHVIDDDGLRVDLGAIGLQEGNGSGDRGVVRNGELQAGRIAHIGATDFHSGDAVVGLRTGIVVSGIRHKGDAVVGQREVPQGLIIRVHIGGQLVDNLAAAAEQTLHRLADGSVVRVGSGHSGERIVGIVHHFLGHVRGRLGVDVVQLEAIAAFSQLQLGCRHSVDLVIPLDQLVVLVHGIEGHAGLVGVDVGLHQDIGLRVVPALRGVVALPQAAGGPATRGDRGGVTLEHGGAVLHQGLDLGVGGFAFLGPLIDGVVHSRLACGAVAGHLIGDIVLHNHGLQIAHVVEVEDHAGGDVVDLVDRDLLAIDGDGDGSLLHASAVKHLLQAQVLVRGGKRLAHGVGVAGQRQIADLAGHRVRLGIYHLLPGVFRHLMVDPEEDLLLVLHHIGRGAVDGGVLLRDDLPALGVDEILALRMGVHEVLHVLLRGQLDSQLLGGIRQERIGRGHLANRVGVLGIAGIALVVGQREQDGVVAVVGAVIVVAPPRRRDLVVVLVVDREPGAGHHFPRIADGIRVKLREGNLAAIEPVRDDDLDRVSAGHGERVAAVDLRERTVIDGHAVDVPVVLVRAGSHRLLQVVGTALAEDVRIAAGPHRLYHAVFCILLADARAGGLAAAGGSRVRVERHGEAADRVVGGIIVAIVDGEAAGLGQLLDPDLDLRAVLHLHRGLVLAVEPRVNRVIGGRADLSRIRDSGHSHIHAAGHHGVVDDDPVVARVIGGSVVVQQRFITGGHSGLDERVDAGILVRNGELAARGRERTHGRPSISGQGVAGGCVRLSGIRGNLRGHVDAAGHIAEQHAIDVELRLRRHQGIRTLGDLLQVDVDQPRVLEGDLQVGAAVGILQGRGRDFDRHVLIGNRAAGLGIGVAQGQAGAIDKARPRGVGVLLVILSRVIRSGGRLGQLVRIGTQLRKGVGAVRVGLRGALSVARGQRQADVGHGIAGFGVNLQDRQVKLHRVGHVHDAAFLRHGEHARAGIGVSQLVVVLPTLQVDFHQAVGAHGQADRERIRAVRVVVGAVTLDHDVGHSACGLRIVDIVPRLPHSGIGADQAFQLHLDAVHIGRLLDGTIVEQLLRGLAGRGGVLLERIIAELVNRDHRVLHRIVDDSQVVQRGVLEHLRIGLVVRVSDGPGPVAALVLGEHDAIDISVRGLGDKVGVAEVPVHIAGIIIARRLVDEAQVGPVVHVAEAIARRRKVLMHPHRDGVDRPALFVLQELVPDLIGRPLRFLAFLRRIIRVVYLWLILLQNGPALSSCIR